MDPNGGEAKQSEGREEEMKTKPKLRRLLSGLVYMFDFLGIHPHSTFTVGNLHGGSLFLAFLAMAFCMDRRIELCLAFAREKIANNWRSFVTVPMERRAAAGIKAKWKLAIL